jgi:hypothetical protein
MVQQSKLIERRQIKQGKLCAARKEGRNVARAIYVMRAEMDATNLHSTFHALFISVCHSTSYVFILI